MITVESEGAAINIAYHIAKEVGLMIRKHHTFYRALRKARPWIPRPRLDQTTET